MVLRGSRVDRGALCLGLLFGPWHNAKTMCKKRKVSVLRSKWSTKMESTFATYHFNIVFISLRVTVVRISDFFRPCQYFAALKSFSIQDHYIFYCCNGTCCSAILIPNKWRFKNVKDIVPHHLHLGTNTHRSWIGWISTTQKRIRKP